MNSTNGAELTHVQPKCAWLRINCYLLAKRMFDVFGALLACILLLAPSFVIVLLIKLDSTGPAIFRQERLGLRGKPFVIYKFRTMKMDAEANGPMLATKNDSRCTKIGSILRKLRIDEWPQFWNVLKGDMSIVGPRPERACFYTELSKSLPRFSERLAIKPGLTGYAQTFGGLELEHSDKLRFDLFYLENCSLLLDLRCIMKTARVLLSLLRDTHG